MDELNSHRDRLEANLETLNKFEGLESDLIQQHGNLRNQFTAYREAIESASFGVNEQEKKEHLAHHDELIKKLHQLILVAKGLARKRTEQMTRDELFKISQERQKSIKPQSPEDRVGEEVTKSLKRMLETMKIEVERSATNISTARSTTKNLNETSENYKNLSGTLDESRSLIRDLWRKNRNDMIYIFGALGIFLATAIWVIMQRIPGIILIPGKFVINQLKNINLMKKSPIEIIVNNNNNFNEDSLSSSSNENEMFIDTIPKRKESAVEDEILFNIDEIKKEIETENEIKTVDSLIENSTIESSKESESINVDSVESIEVVENIDPSIEFNDKDKVINLNLNENDKDNAKIVELPESFERLESEPIKNLDLDLDSVHVNKENESVALKTEEIKVDNHVSENDSISGGHHEEKIETNSSLSSAPVSTKAQIETTTTSTVQNLPVETAKLNDEQIKNIIEVTATITSIKENLEAITNTSNEFAIEEKEIIQPITNEVPLNILNNEPEPNIETLKSEKKEIKVVDIVDDHDIVDDQIQNDQIQNDQLQNDQLQNDQLQNNNPTSNVYAEDESITATEAKKMKKTKTSSLLIPDIDDKDNSQTDSQTENFNDDNSTNSSSEFEYEEEKEKVEL